MAAADRLITVFGGSGFLGRHVVRALARAGYRVRVATRRPDLCGHLQPMGDVGQIHAVQANLRYPASVATALEGADAAVNLAGILFPTKWQSFAAVHVAGAQAVAQAAKAAGVEKLIHVSSLAADLNSTSDYARTKAEGEARVSAGFPGAVILRPSVVFGPDDQFFNRFASLARLAPGLPLIGGGHTRMQPVYVGDVALAVEQVLAAPTDDDKVSGGVVYEIGGPEIFTFREILEFILKVTQRRRALVALPFGVARALAYFTQILPNPVLTVDQVRLLEVDNVVSATAKSSGRTLDGLGVLPRSIEELVPPYLHRFRATGEFETTAA
ncbi:MAG: complex I NDUFA9 subunit family protein [Alphaproteobacteria bacterium]